MPSHLLMRCENNKKSVVKCQFAQCSGVGVLTSSPFPPILDACNNPLDIML